VNRRQILTHAVGLIVGSLAARTFAQSAASQPNQAADKSVIGQLTVEFDASGHLIPQNFTGLSYELAQLKDPNFFAPGNKQLIALFRQLSPAGVLRLGGNSSETCWLKINDFTQPPIPPKVDLPPDQHWMPTQLFQIMPQAIDNLSDFLNATGWQVIFGLNLGHSSPDRLALEAQFIAAKLGESILYFQLGNEPDFYSATNNRTRPPNWGFSDYIREWLACAQAILHKVPDARFGGPDVGSTSNWIPQFIPPAAQKLGTCLVAVSGHYYAEGPPDDPSVTSQRLLHTSHRVATTTSAIADLAHKNGLVYRMTEGNSCYRGGKPGMSDAFAAALWAGDYMLTLAANGCAGVNLHGGSASLLRAALGNHMPGEKVATPATHTSGGYYTPIAGELDQGFNARPIFYGMYLANQFAGCRFKPSALTAPGIDANAYACQKDGHSRVAIFNKDPVKTLTLSILAPPAAGKAKLWRMTAPSIHATTGVKLAGAEFKPDAAWSPATEEATPVKDGQLILDIPPDTAALVFFVA